MRVEKLLIPLSYINEACFVSSNIDEKKIKTSLKRAQLRLRELLGAEFYEEIETQYKPVNDTFSTDNSTLYENYIKDYLAWQSYFYFIGFSQTESTPTGERSFTDDNSALATDIQLFSKEKNIKQVAYEYQSSMINFLRNEQSKNSTKYPKWEDNCKEEFSFGISGIGKDSKEESIFAINKATVANE